MSFQVLHGGSDGWSDSRTESDFNAMSGPNFAAEADLSWSAGARFGKKIMTRRKILTLLVSFC